MTKFANYRAVQQAYVKVFTARTRVFAATIAMALIVGCSIQDFFTFLKYKGKWIHRMCYFQKRNFNFDLVGEAKI